MGPTLAEEDLAAASAPSLAAVARGGMEQADAEQADVGPARPPEKVDRAVGFTVWRDDEQKGFLDLYNLPPVEEGQPFLWVRGSELEPYHAVGFIPVSENGTGSFFYSVDEPEFTPTGILITVEPDGTMVWGRPVRT